jgi:hypothetical protein
VDAEKRKRVGVLAVATALLAAALAWQFWPARVDAPARDTARPAVAHGKRPQTAGPPDPATLDVRLDRLGQERREPEEAGRDPFRFRPAPPPPPPPPPPPVNAGGIPGAGTGGSSEPGQPPPPPPPPPITLKFIGVVTREAKAKVAVLSDGKFVFQGREGDIIEGRYRVVRIGEESVQMEYVDGRGRQTIRLSGS